MTQNIPKEVHQVTIDPAALEHQIEQIARQSLDPDSAERLASIAQMLLATLVEQQQEWRAKSGRDATLQLRYQAAWLWLSQLMRQYSEAATTEQRAELRARMFDQWTADDVGAPLLAELEAARAVASVVDELLRSPAGWKDEQHIPGAFRHQLTVVMGAYDAARKAREE